MRSLLCSLCVIAILATVTPAFAQEIEGELFFWASSVECETPGAKPAFNFDGEMVCGCVKDGSFTGPCYDLGYKVKEMPPAQAIKIAAEMSGTSALPIAADQCQTIPQQFLDSALYYCNVSGQTWLTDWDAK